MSSVRNGDLRSEAKDRRRVKSHKTKWSKGALPAPGKMCSHNPGSAFGIEDPCADCAKRPYPSQRPYWPTTWVEHSYRSAAQNRARKAMINDTHAAQEEYSDGSISGDAYDATANDDFMYSFDAYSGPHAGSQVLNNAVVQAVERFENKETEKMVREYDLVADGKDELDFTSAEDDFELVDPSKL